MQPGRGGVPDELNSSNDGDDERSIVSRPVDVMRSAMIERLLRRKSKWRQYGNYHVCCRGRIMIGPVRSWWWLLELLTIVVTVTLILEYEKYYIAVVVFGVLIALVALVSSWRTTMCDPGVIPRKPFPEALQQARQVDAMIKAGNSYLHVEREHEGRLVTHNYCFRCHLFRPPKTVHCSTCNTCTLEVDHHCPIFGGCVTKRNIGWFRAMAISMAMLYPYLLIVGLITAINEYGKGTVNIFEASLLADEVIVAICLACTITPLLACLPCEKRRSMDSISGTGIYDNTSQHKPYPRISRPPHYHHKVAEEFGYSFPNIRHPVADVWNGNTADESLVQILYIRK